MKPSEVCGLLDGLAPDALRAAMMLAPAPVADRIDRYLGEWWTVRPDCGATTCWLWVCPAGQWWARCCARSARHDWTG